MDSLVSMRAQLPDDEWTKRLDSLVPVALRVVAESNCRKSRRAAFVVSPDFASVWSYGTIEGCPADCHPACALVKDFAGAGNVHAEQSAIRHANRSLVGATMVHIKLDDEGRLMPSGKRYCPICLPEMLAAGIWLLTLYHDDGWWLYRLDDIKEVADGNDGTQAQTLPARPGLPHHP